MDFLLAVVLHGSPLTNNQLRTSSNLRNHATIQDGRVTVQQVQGWQGQSYAGTGYMGNATSSGQCTQSKRPRNAAWFKNKVILAEAQEFGQILDEEKLAFLADQHSRRAVLMANLSNYGSDVISEKAQRIKPTLYDGSVISSQHAVIPVIYDEETLILEEVKKVLDNATTLSIPPPISPGMFKLDLVPLAPSDVLLSGSRDTNLYTISLDDMLKTSPICLLSKASKTKSWLWHRRLSHLNFGTLNQLAKAIPHLFELLGNGLRYIIAIVIEFSRSVSPEGKPSKKLAMWCYFNAFSHFSFLNRMTYIGSNVDHPGVDAMPEKYMNSRG
ncbi:retrovirus-related pol polyprotein from transposon TNT 1-94 [Tanacetum coccineum]|uniref:Retrovirus-related pol polyprotein from transposon TNT 1-94 n=1 Tax=Tanacetum coccineum TaxID=301880 RepID=A0ABQ5J6J8_9ASTR